MHRFVAFSCHRFTPFATPPTTDETTDISRNEHYAFHARDTRSDPGAERERERERKRLHATAMLEHFSSFQRSQLLLNESRDLKRRERERVKREILSGIRHESSFRTLIRKQKKVRIGQDIWKQFSSKHKPSLYNTFI